jgi:hypothetical protein
MSAADALEPPYKVSMEDIAFQYLMLGLSPIPVAIGDKRPALEAWQTYSSRRPYPQEIKNWWKVNPAKPDQEFGIGFATGRVSRIVVLDCDDWDLSQLVLKKYPTKWVAISPGHNSYHLYYQYPSGVDRVPNAKLFGGKADFKADGGFIVAPPTVHPNGRRYVWHSKEGAFPSELPTDLFDMVMGRGSSSKDGTDHWIATLLREGSRSGNRDADATRLAGYFVKKGMARDVILLQMQPWFDKTDADRDFTWKSVEKCVDSVIQTNKRSNPHSGTEEVMGVTSVNNPRDHVSSFFEYIEGDEEDEEEIKYLIEGWLPMNSTALMVAPPGTYKTWLMVAMAVSVACGVPFMGGAAPTPHPVLIIQQEDSKDIIKQRLRTVWGSMAGIRSEQGEDKDGVFIKFFNLTKEPELMIKESDKLIHFDDPDSMQLLKELIEEFKFKLVFIDPLYMSADADNYMAKAAQQMGVLKALRDAYGVTFVVLHHTKKSTAEEGVQRMDAWGSQFINAWLETGIQIRPTDIPNTVQVMVHFKNAEGKKAHLVQFTIDTNPATRAFQMDVIDPNAPVNSVQTPKDDSGKFAPKINDTHVEIVLLEAAGALSAVEITNMICERYGTSISERTVRDRIKRMVKEGKMVEHADHTFSLVVKD